MTETVATPPPADPPAATTDDDVADSDVSPGPDRRAARGRATTRFWAGLVAMALVIGVVVGAVAAYAVHAGTPTYQSQGVLEIDQAGAIAASPDDGVVAKLARLRYAYAGLVRTQAFFGPLANSTGLDPTVVASSLYALVDPSSLLLVVGARGSDAARTKTIATAAAGYLVDFARNRQRDAGIPTAQQVTFAVVTPAGDAVKIAPTDHRVALVGIGAFLFVALGTMGFGYLWRRDS